MNNDISIICATYNAQKTLDDFFSSVRNQTCKNYELIIVDGDSTDNTIAIIEKNRDIVSKYISEPDKGIYDAWNKGIKLATGDWLCFVGSDDVILPGFVEVYTNAISQMDYSVDYISSKVRYIDSNGKLLLTLGKDWIWDEFKNKMTTAHVGSLHNRSLLNEVGIYNINYKIVGDYELLLRKRDRLKTLFVDQVTVNMLAGGVSLTYQALVERRRAQRQTGKRSALSSWFIFFIGIFALLKLKLNVK